MCCGSCPVGMGAGRSLGWDSLRSENLDFLPTLGHATPPRASRLQLPFLPQLAAVVLCRSEPCCGAGDRTLVPRLVPSRALLLLVDRPTGPGPVVLGNVRLSLGQEVEQEKQRTGAESLLAEEGLGVTGPQEGRGFLCPALSGDAGLATPVPRAWPPTLKLWVDPELLLPSLTLASSHSSSPVIGRGNPDREDLPSLQRPVAPVGGSAQGKEAGASSPGVGKPGLRWAPSC